MPTPWRWITPIGFIWRFESDVDVELFHLVVRNDRIRVWNLLGGVVDVDPIGLKFLGYWRIGTPVLPILDPSCFDFGALEAESSECPPGPEVYSPDTVGWVARN